MHISWPVIVAAIASILLLLAMTSYYARRITSLRTENGDLKKKVGDLSSKAMIATPALAPRVPVVELYTRFVSAAGPVLLAAFAFGTLCLSYLEKQGDTKADKNKCDTMKAAVNRLLGPEALDKLPTSTTQARKDQQLIKLTLAEKKSLLELRNNSITDAKSSQYLIIKTPDSGSRIIVVPLPETPAGTD